MTEKDMRAQIPWLIAVLGLLVAVDLWLGWGLLK